MASINSLMRSSGGTNSIYGNRNVISGLASGMDTEAMIENAVKGHKLKITNLEKQRSKVEWQQEAYRNIINKLSNFSLKYSNYTSSTNLSSPSFFNNAVEILTHGANAGKVTATGKTSNAVQIDSVTSLANDARYTTTSTFKPSNTASQAVDIVGGSQTVGALEGSLTLKYGTSELKITFNEGDVFTKPQDMVDAINKQLENQSIKSSSGEVKASERVQAVRVGNTICFKTVNNDAGNSFSVEHVDDKLNETLGIGKNSDGKFELSFAYKDFTTQKKVMDVVAENVTNAQTTRTENGGAYRRKMVVFQAVDGKNSFRQAMADAENGLVSNRRGAAAGGVRVTQIVDDPSPLKRVFDPVHPDADENGYVEMPNVDMVKEMTDAMAAAQAYSANVTALNTLKGVIAKGLEIGR